MTYKVTTELSNRKIADQIITAFEGGITYWATDAILKNPKDSGAVSPWYDDEELYGAPFEIEITETEEADSAKHILTQQKLQTGLNVLAEKYPHHLTAIVEETGDAWTADALIQCALFGDIIYG